MQTKIFITGTDTEVGKTFFSCALIRALQNASIDVMAFKPVAAGAEFIDGQFKNDDALALIDALDVEVDYQQLNPIVLEKPIAPHIAAAENGVDLSVQNLQKLIPLADFEQQVLVVEGAGGWLVPLNSKETLADYAIAENLSVILVVGLKLGCINHALLTKRAIESAGLNLAGWVANHIDPAMLEQRQNIEFLSRALDCPLIAELPYFENSDKKQNVTEIASEYVRIEPILSPAGE